MSSVCVLTPMVIGGWPIIANAVLGAAAAMGFNVVAQSRNQLPEGEQRMARERVEADVPNSDVLAENVTRDQRIVIEKNGVTLEFGVDARGRCTVCASGVGIGKNALKRIAEEASGRVVQQFAYHKLMTELANRKFRIIEERVEGDDSIQVRVALNQ